VTTFGKRNRPDDPALSPRLHTSPAPFWKREIPALYWVPAVLIVAAILVLRIVSGA